MIIVLKQHAPADKVQAFCNELNSMGFQINDSVGSDTHILGLIGDTKALAESWVLANPWSRPAAACPSRTKRPTASSTPTTPSSTWAATRSAAVTLPS